MSTTRYEAAALYDSSRQKAGHPARYLVLDLDTGSAGACSCAKDGKAKLGHCRRRPTFGRPGWGASRSCWGRITPLMWRRS